MDCFVTSQLQTKAMHKRISEIKRRRHHFVSSSRPFNGI